MFLKVKRIIGLVLLSACLLTLIFIGYIRITGENPSFFGFSLLRVSSDSMEPELSLGEIVMVKNVDPATLGKGDVITYRCTKGYNKGQLVTHQISKEPYEKDGVYYFTTRGIKPGSVDDPEIKDSQIRGEVLYKIPYLGTVYDFFTEWYGMLAFAVLLVLIFGEDVVNLIRRFSKKDLDALEIANSNPADFRQSQDIESIREKEFEGIITNLNDSEL